MSQVLYDQEKSIRPAQAVQSLLEQDEQLTGGCGERLVLSKRQHLLKVCYSPGALVQRRVQTSARKVEARESQDGAG